MTPGPEPRGGGLRFQLSPLQHPIIWVSAVHIALAVLLFDPKPFLGGDNYWYMELAQGLREGAGYRDLWLPDAPAHTRYPPVYPVLLAGLGLIGQSVILFKLLSLAFTTGISVLVYLLAERRTGERQLALFAALATASAPVLVEYSHWVLSEPAFVFFVVLAFYAFTRDAQRLEARWFAIGTAAALSAALTRTAGYPLLLAVILALSVQHRWKRAAIFTGATVLLVGGWWLRNRLAVSGDVPYSQWLLYRDPYQPELGMVAPLELVSRFARNLEQYALTVLPQSIAGRDLGGALAALLGVTLAAGTALGGLLRIRRLEVPELFFGLYLGLILLWPEAWGDQRLLLPLLPLVAVLMMEAVDWALRVRGWARRAGSMSLFIAGTLFVGLATFGNIRIMPPALGCAREYWRGNQYACYPPPAGDFIETAIWAGENTETSAIVINRKPQIFYWYGRRPGDVYPYTENTDSIMSFLDSKEASYVVIDMWSATTLRYLIPAIQENVDRFTVVHQQGNPPSYLLRYRPGGDGASE